MRVSWLATLLLCSSVTAAPRAWWLDSYPQALGASFRGVPASQLPNSFTRLSPLSCTGPTRQFTPAQCAELKANHAAFSLRADLNGDGQLDLAQTAVGLLPSGNHVAVLLITSTGKASVPAVFVQPGNGFSVLRREPGGLAWSTCIECGQSISIRWSPKHHAYVELPADDFSAAPSNNSSKPTPLRGAA